MIPILYIIVPCYNEQQVLKITSAMFREELLLLIKKEKIHPDSRIMFVNDGSKDGTWSIIEQLTQEDKCFIGISQSRNRGHQNAVFAGLMEAKEYADITISIDCDGQDDISAMENMVDAYEDGADIVYGVRNNRDADSLFKRFTAELFYTLLNKLGVESVFNHADYRLISSKVLQELANFKEVNLFLRGMIPLVGFRSACVYYQRHERIAGESHYSVSKMVDLAFNGITSLSIKPIRLILGAGIFASFTGFIAIVVSLIMKYQGTVTDNLYVMLSAMYFICGFQLMCMGILGEYIGKIYMESKERPRYIISERIGDVYQKETKLHVVSSRDDKKSRIIHM